MFTGIIRHVGTVTDVRTSPSGGRLSINLGSLAEATAVGDSVSVCGVCLTAAALSGSIVVLDVVAETLRRTTLGELRTGARVNLERPLRPNQGLDGHLVQGHVDAVATVRAVRRRGEWRVEFAGPTELTDLMVPKGSVAVDGVSLTLADLAAGRFAVALVPTTLAATTLADLAAGDRVNVETDVIGKYVRKHLRQDLGAAGGLTLEKLAEAGFLD